MFAAESLTPSLANSQTVAMDLPYAIGDSVRWILPRPGDLLYCWVPAAAAAIVEGDDLVSDGAGNLKKATAATAVTVGISRQIVGKAAEAVNNSGGGSPARIRVRVV
jgi:hypothetical protein